MKSRNISLEEENIRLKLSLIQMICQFYEYKTEDKIQYYHLCESAGESAWKMLGINEDIVSEKYLENIEKELCNNLSKIHKNNKNKTMEWYVYWHDFNAKKIIKWNIFEHGTFRKELDKMHKKYKTKEEFAEKLDSIMRYYFWSKCEHEVIIAPWVGDATEVKIDVYDQLHMNWDAFVDYVWNFKED